jgi:DMSO/TMAO reductase YedYZ molybdopterin-dependent catalytic subunit
MSMKPNKYILGCFLILTFLIGCTQQVTNDDMPQQVVEETALARIESSTPPDTSVLNSTKPLSITQTAGKTPTLASSQITELATSQNDNFILPACQPEPVTQLPQPVKTFQPNEFDSENRLHVTGLSQWIDLVTYRLKVTGLVDHPLSLSYDEIRCLPKVTDNPELVCPGVFTDYASWTGVSIRDVLALAGVQSEATNLTLISADGYQVKLPLETARGERNFFAYQVNGKPLPIQHGFPLRAIFPEMWGSYWLKWLVEIRLS